MLLHSRDTLCRERTPFFARHWPPHTLVPELALVRWTREVILRGFSPALLCGVERTEHEPLRRISIKHLLFTIAIVGREWKADFIPRVSVEEFTGHALAILRMVGSHLDENCFVPFIDLSQCQSRN